MSASPATSCVSLKSMDPPGNLTGNFTPNPIVKRKRSDSPAPSCVKSMDEPGGNFKKEYEPPDSRVKLERSDSPAPSCVKSMDEPGNFKKEYEEPDSRVMKLEKLHSPGLHSMVSEDFKRESSTPAHSSEVAASLLTKEDFRCSVCTGVLNDPVSIPCGHSYCRQCITSYWERPNQAGHFACPQCPHTYSSRPALYSNSSLAQVIHKLEHFSPVLPVQSYAGPGDVECNFCTGRKLKAVKTCLTCTASYCDTHVKEHYTIPALQRHTLVEAVENQEDELIHTEFKQKFVQGQSEEFQTFTSRMRHFKPEDSKSRKPNPAMIAAIQQEISRMKRKLPVLEDMMCAYGHKVQKAGETITRQSMSHLEDIRCSCCSYFLKDPVSIPCGHSYCRQCITSFWEQPNQAGHYTCPQCPHTYSSRPALDSNRALAEVVHRQREEAIQRQEDELQRQLEKIHQQKEKLQQGWLEKRQQHLEQILQQLFEKYLQQCLDERGHQENIQPQLLENMLQQLLDNMRLRWLKACHQSVRKLQPQLLEKKILQLAEEQEECIQTLERKLKNSMCTELWQCHTTHQEQEDLFAWANPYVL